MLSHQQIQNNWPTIKSHVLSKWNKLSESEVEKTHGEFNSLEKLVHTRYGDNEDFDRTYDQICKSSIHSSIPTSKNTSTPGEKKFSSRQANGVPDFENRSRTAPSAEAGMSAHDSVSTDETFHTGSPEKRVNTNFAKVENSNEGLNREADDELSHYTTSSRVSELDGDDSAEFNKFNNYESNTHFSAPDEFYPFQDPSPSREDITLGRNTSSATKISTAQAASNSSEASNDAKKKV